MIYGKKVSWWVVFAVLLLFSASCARIPPRLKVSGRDTGFYLTEDVPYEIYVAQTRELILASRDDVKVFGRDKVLEANSPFILEPDPLRFPRNPEGMYDKGILLIHGLSDSPYHMKDLAVFFQEKGYFVLGLLLPGHGPVPAVLKEVKYQDWLAAVEYAMKRLRTDAATVSMGGFSTGGTLSVHYALRNQDVDALFLFAPALGIKTKFAFLAGIGDFFIDWLDVQDDEDYAKYESFPVNAGAQIYRLTTEVDELIEDKGINLEMPVFVTLSFEDQTVNSEKTLDCFSGNFISEKNRLLLYKAGGDEKNGKMGDPRVRLVNSYLEGEKVFDYSHQALTMPAEDPHYGKNGDYRNCLHYTKGTEKYDVCKEGVGVWSGERSGKNLRKGVTRRLTYNPLFGEMLREIEIFLDESTR